MIQSDRDSAMGNISVNCRELLIYVSMDPDRRIDPQNPLKGWALPDLGGMVHRRF
jgi:hypothetical protein